MNSLLCAVYAYKFENPKACQEDHILSEALGNIGRQALNLLISDLDEDTNSLLTEWAQIERHPKAVEEVIRCIRATKGHVWADLPEPEKLTLIGRALEPLMASKEAMREIISKIEVAQQGDSGE